jgi:parallel beta-helix repeat protein
MSERQRIRLAAIPAVVAAGCMLLLLGLLSGPTPVRADPGTLYVSPSGDDVNDCSSYANRCHTVQRAVDVAGPGDEILVATGIYTGVQARAGVTQVVYISKSVSIRGGYSADFATRDLDNYPTTMDAESQGRIIYLTGGISSTLEGLRLTNGLTDGDGGSVYAIGNTATWIHLTIGSCQLYNNSAGGDRAGGALFVDRGNNLDLMYNRFYSNSAAHGAGIYLTNISGARLTGNEIFDNVASQSGGGLSFGDVFGLILTNNVIVENQITGSGNGAGLYGSAPFGDIFLLHTTIARNSGGNGQGIYAINGTWWLTNTILVSHSVGIRTSAATAHLEHTLWGAGDWANTTDTLGSNIYTGTVNIRDEPGFIDPDHSDYHIDVSSAAINEGVATSLDTDIDGDSRPLCTSPDLGADESTAACCAAVNTTLYSNIQAAIDAASTGDLIKVSGTCQGVHNRGVYTQVAYIDDTVTVRGGYSPDFATWDPKAHPTILDAQGLGNVVVVDGAGTAAPTLETLQLTNGSTSQYGAGIYVNDAHPVISRCQVYSNTSGKSGGGIALWDATNSTLVSNYVYSNASGASGGGIYLYRSDGSTLTDNAIFRNNALDGGGLYMNNSDTVMTNTALFHNQASSDGSGMETRSSAIHLLHSTIARNRSGNGHGIYAWQGSNLWLTNTILVSHTVGISLTAGSSVTMVGTLWGSGSWANETPWGGDGIVVTSIDVFGDPAFVNPDFEDYHIQPTSAAVDAGVPTGVETDIESDPRSPTDPDLGADEVAHLVYLPLVLRSY